MGFPMPGPSQAARSLGGRNYMRVVELLGFGKKVQKLRERDGLSTRDIARRLGIASSTLNERMRRYQALVPRRCSDHIRDGEVLPYLDWHQKSEEATKQGLRQQKCPQCGRFYWPWELKRRP